MYRRAFSSNLASVLVGLVIFSTLYFSSHGVDSAQDLYVFSTTTGYGTGTSFRECWGGDVSSTRVYTSIQAAVDAVSGDGQIILCPGFYNESVNVYKSVTIRAYDIYRGYASYTWSGSAPHVFIFPSNFAPGVSIFTVTAPGVVISDIAFNSTFDQGGISRTAAIVVQNVENTIITRNFFYNNSYAVYLSNANETNVSSNVLLSNERAIESLGSSNLAIHENIINAQMRTCGRGTVTRACSGISLVRSSNSRIYSNKVSQIRGTGVYDGYGVLDLFQQNSVEYLPNSAAVFLFSTINTTVHNMTVLRVSAGFKTLNDSNTILSRNNVTRCANGFEIDSLGASLESNNANNCTEGFVITSANPPDALAPISQRGAIYLTDIFALNGAWHNTRHGLVVKSINPVVVSRILLLGNKRASLYVQQPPLNSPLSLNIDRSIIYGAPGRYSHIIMDLPATANPSNLLNISETILYPASPITDTRSLLVADITDYPAVDDYSVTPIRNLRYVPPLEYDYYKGNFSLTPFETINSRNFNIENLTFKNSDARYYGLNDTTVRLFRKVPGSWVQVPNQQLDPTNSVYNILTVSNVNTSGIYTLFAKPLTT